MTLQTFKLTPKPQSDYRLEINEIKDLCKLEKHGYRHNKIVYGFSEALPDITELQSRGINIEEIPFNEAQLSLTNDLVERGRAKTKVDHLTYEQVEKGSENQDEQEIAQQRLTDLNNYIQAAKETLSITGITKSLRF